MTTNTEQPTLDTEGEWSYWVVTGRYKIHDAQGQQVATADSEETAAQIVADHKAAKSQALLVEALREAREFASQHTWGKDNKANAREAEAVVARINAALKAAGVTE